MTNLSLFSKGALYLWLKIILAVWMFAIIFMYLLLFGPPEFWLFVRRLGLEDVLQAAAAWLRPFFTAEYLA